MDFFEQISVLLYLAREISVFAQEDFDVVSVLDRVQCDLGRDRVGAFCRDQECGGLHAGEHRQEEVEEDIRIWVEGSVVKDTLQDVGVQRRPDNHDGEK